MSALASLALIKNPDALNAENNLISSPLLAQEVNGLADKGEAPISGVRQKRPHEYFE